MNLNQILNLAIGGLTTTMIITALVGGKNTAPVIKEATSGYALMTRSALGKDK